MYASGTLLVSLSLFHVKNNSNVSGTKFDHKSTISRIEKSLIWRRVNKVYDVEAMAKEVEPEVNVVSA